MRNFTWNRVPIKHLLIDSLLTLIVESTYLNRDMCKFESSQKDESRWQSTDSPKAYRNTSAFKWQNFNGTKIFWQTQHISDQSCTVVFWSTICRSLFKIPNAAYSLVPISLVSSCHNHRWWQLQGTMQVRRQRGGQWCPASCYIHPILYF